MGPERAVNAVNYVTIFTIVFTAIWIICLTWRRPRVSKAQVDPEQKKFLEAALDDEPVKDARNPYTWDALQRDLYDKKVTFEEIWEKAGGFPERPTNDIREEHDE